MNQEDLVSLANKHEPEASMSPPGRRLSKCADCSKRMLFPWHVWLHTGGFKKELHICNTCWKRWKKLG